MAADALAPFVTRTSTAMILTMYYRYRKSLSYMREDLNYLCHINVGE